MSRPTGWHYHECDGQFIYILKGWVDLQFEDGRTLRIEEGNSLFIPGYLRHNEIRTSEADGDPRGVRVPARWAPHPATRRRGLRRSRPGARYIFRTASRRLAVLITHREARQFPRRPPAC